MLCLYAVDVYSEPQLCVEKGGKALQPHRKIYRAELYE